MLGEREKENINWREIKRGKQNRSWGKIEKWFPVSMSVFIPLAREIACKPLIASAAGLTPFPRRAGEGCAALILVQGYLCSKPRS